MTDAPRTLALADLTPDTLVEQWPIVSDYFQGLRPHNWREYLLEVIEEAKRTHATELVYPKNGEEGLVFELLRNETPMWAMLRIQTGGMPVSGIDGILPFYSDRIVEFPGDPESEHTVMEPNQRRDINPFMPYPYGMRITTMPRVIINKRIYGWDGLLPGITDDDMVAVQVIHDGLMRLFAAQGHAVLDQSSENTGYYLANDGSFLPAVFDPGNIMQLEYPAGVDPDSSRGQERTENIVARALKPREPWTEPLRWLELRREVAADAQRLYAGEPTSYAMRMERNNGAAMTGDNALISLLIEKRTQR